MEWTLKNIQILPHLNAKIKKGRGLGSKGRYLPWNSFRTRGSGTADNLFGIVTKRRHDLPTDLDRTFLYLVERDPRIVDIRESFPILDLKRTLTICGRLGIAHPKVGGKPDAFVIPFVLTYEFDGVVKHEAIALVDEEQTLPNATVSELDVQRTWCSEVGIGWNAVRKDQLTECLQQSIRYLRGWYRHRYEPEVHEVRLISEIFSEVHDRTKTLKQLIAEVARRSRIDASRCEDAFRFAGWSKVIPVDPFSPIALDRPVAFLQP